MPEITGFTIFTRPQVTPRWQSVHGAFGAVEQRETTIPAPVYPPGCQVAYEPDLDLYSADDSARRVLLTDPAGTASLTDIFTAFPDIFAAKFSDLWQAAHNYEQQYISGVGLSILSLGVAQGKPKALDVAAWSQNLWSLYYQRKAGISIAAQPDTDFTPAGEMPYSVPELSAEVWTP